LSLALAESLTLADVRAERDRRRWLHDPVAYIRERFGAEPDAWQVKALAAFPTSPRLAFKACKGPGKTAVLAWLIWNFLETRSSPKVGATSITEDNLNDNLWPELAKWQGQSDVLSREYTWTKTRIVRNSHPETVFASARTWPKSADPQRQSQTLAGLHADQVLFVLDESGSIPQAVMTTAEAVLANEGVEAHVVQAGNPDTREGPLFRACVTDRHLWAVVEITGDPDDPDRSPRISLAYAREQIDTYGRDNPWVQVNVLGKFPETSLNALLGDEDVLAAMKREVPESVYTWAQMRLGVDVARYGDDRTVLFPRQGRKAFMPKIMRHIRDSAVSTDIATAVLEMKASLKAEAVAMDATGGWAAGTHDVLKATSQAPVNVQFHAPSGNPRYRNKRAEMWFAMAEWVKGGGGLPNIPELIGELTTPTYTFVGGKFLIEPKEQVKARLGRSPDLADALALTFAIAERAPTTLKAPTLPPAAGGWKSA
jgi:hypothetical protein